MHTDQSFNLFNANVAHKSQGLVGEPALEREQRTAVRLEVSAQPIPYWQRSF